MKELDKLFNHTCLNSIFAALKSEGAGIRFVGGCVRDALLKKTIADVDIATDLLPDRVAFALSKANIKHILLGKDYGTIAVVSKGIKYEITTLRKDVMTNGRHAVISYTKDWEEDAYRRDFTINAMSYCPYVKKLYDYSTGVEDTKSNLVRFIGAPEDRVKEDYLRILRYFRFVSMFASQRLDKDSFDACVKYCDDLSKISGERKWAELSKILQVGNLEVISLMVDSGVMKRLIGEVRVGYKEMLARLEGDAFLLRLLILISDKVGIDELSKSLKWPNILRKRLVGLRKTAVLLDISDMFYLLSKYGKEMLRDALKLRIAMGYSSDEKKIKELDEVHIPDFPVNGDDIMKEFNLPSGREVGKLLSLARMIWCNEMGVTNKKQILKKIKQKYARSIIIDKKK